MLDPSASELPASSVAGSTAQADRRLGIEAARHLYDNWDPDAAFDRETEAGFAEGFLDEYSSIQRARAKSVDRQSSKRAGRSAVQLMEEAFRGILEVLQNAEDEEATYLTVASRRKGARRELLFVHDGNRVKPTTVVAMSSAYLSLKEGNAQQIGKFGIGLKTLQRLGPELEVHCAPYHWAILDGDATRIDSAEAIPGIYEAGSTQTLLVLRLHGSVSREALHDWFASTSSETLLFLNNVRTLEYREIGRRPRTLRLAMSEGKRREYPLTVGRRDVQCTELLLKSTGRDEWRRYSVNLPVGKHRRRSKMTGDSVPVAVAVPKARTDGLLFSGLPTSERTGLPLHLGGPFEPDVSRERLDTGSQWNEWLLDQMRMFVQALAARELEKEPGRAWPLIGLKEDLKSHAPRWLTKQMQAFIEREQSGLRAAEVLMGDRVVRLSDVVFEASALEDILTEADIETVRPGSRCLPRAARDRNGRWRSVLRELLDSAEVGVDEAVLLFDDSATAYNAAWYLRLAAISIDAGCGSSLFDYPSVLLQDGTFTFPRRKGHGGLLVSQALAGTDLVSRLALAQRIHDVYTGDAEDAQKVRSFLIQNGAFSDEHSADAVLKALAGRRGDPVVLTDSDIGELAALIAEASEELMKNIGEDLGSAVLVDGYEWIEGKRENRLVAPGAAYLPAALDEKEGWAQAAGTASGILWIHPRYAKLPQLLDAAIGPRKLFRRLGAEVAPRLLPSENTIFKYGESVFRIGWDVPELWRQQRESLRAKTSHYADALIDDRVSPDLVTVAQHIAESRINAERRERSRALVRTLQRAWPRLYEDVAETTALYGYGKWNRLGRISTSFIAELADIEWLSDCSRPSRPAAPVNLRIRSDGNTVVYGEDPSAYAKELGPIDADNPVVVALGIGGLPRASERIEALEALRDSRRRIHWADVAHHYLALSQMCPARVVPNAEVDDMTVGNVAKRFREGRLLWLGKWLSPTEAFRGEQLFPDEGAFVPEEMEYERLWSVLAIPSPKASDCIRQLRKWSAAGKSPSDIGLPLVRTYRALAQGLESTSGRTRKELQKLPVWIGESWVAERPVYYSDSEVFGQTLSRSRHAVWSVPGVLHALGQLPDALGLEMVSPASFSVANRGGTHSVYDKFVSDSFSQAIQLMREFIAQSMPELDELIPDAAWTELEGAEVEIVPALVLAGSLRGRQVKLDAALHLDREEMRFYFEHPGQIGRRDEGGALVADAFDLGSADRLNVSLAWIAAWQRALEGDVQLVFPVLKKTPDYVDSEIVPDALTATPVPGRTLKKPKPKARPREETPERKLKDIDSMVVSASRNASTPPQGSLSSERTETKLDKRRSAKLGESTARRAGRSAPEYNPMDREVAGLRALAKILERHGVEIEDTTARPVGADAIGTDGRYYELKVHGGTASGGLRIESSEVLQAREMGDEYVLVVVENVEDTSANTRVTLIPNPLSVLAVHPFGRVEVTGYDDDSFEQYELS